MLVIPDNTWQSICIFNTVRRVLQDHARRTTDVLLDYGDRCVLHLRSVGHHRRLG